MKHLSVLKPDKPVNWYIWLGVAAVLCSIFMIVVPLFNGGGDWGYVQDFWGRWQTLTAGMLALVSSFIAFNISSYNADKQRERADKQRERDFLASKAFLPAALSELVSYFKDSASVLIKGWESTDESKPEFIIPDLPQGYKEVFVHCIRHAEPPVGDYLSQILVSLQIHDSRLRDYIKRASGKNDFNPEKGTLIGYFYGLGELHALVSNLFEFARNRGEFNSRPLNWEDFNNAYVNLDVRINKISSEIYDLEAYTKRYIAEAKPQDT